MTIALLDDSLSDMNILYQHILRYCKEHNVHMFVKKFTIEAAFLNSLHTTTYSLVFLDIYMEHMNGIQIAKKIQEADAKCQIIFTTTSTEHAVKAFRLHALDYLVKPYAYPDLADALTRFGKIALKFAHYIELKEGRHYTRVLISDIMYTDYHNHYIQVHTASCMIRSYMSFNDFSPMLSSYPQFLQCYRNCMVNIDYIDSFNDQDFILKNGERLPISRAHKQNVLQAYANYIFDNANGGIAL